MHALQGNLNRHFGVAVAETIPFQVSVLVFVLPIVYIEGSEATSFHLLKIVFVCLFSLLVLEGIYYYWKLCVFFPPGGLKQMEASQNCLVQVGSGVRQVSRFLRWSAPSPCGRSGRCRTASSS